MAYPKCAVEDMGIGKEGEQRMNCPICNHKMNVEEILKGKTNTPNILQQYVEDVAKYDIPLYHCPNCGHGYIENLLADDFYDAFTVAMDDKTEEHRMDTRNVGFDRIITRLLEINRADNESILEIGSGRGYLLKRASEHYQYALGVEPSKVEARVAQQLGLNIIVDYFEDKNAIDCKFSSFISTMVFEHLPDPKASISYAFKLLKEGGSGIIQVPNAQRTFMNKIYFDVYPQHLHYYTPLSLAKLTFDAGFEVISLQETSERNYLEVCVRKPMSRNSFEDKLKADQTFFEEYLPQFKTIALWGASYAARSCIYLLNDFHIAHFFDVSNSKIGGYINDCNTIIEYPNQKKVDECDLIIITANEYTTEIMNSLKIKYHYHGTVIYFDESCQLVKIKLD